MQDNSSTTILLTGDVMLGRGIDQILLFNSDPVLYERGTQDARDYVKLAERKKGPIPDSVDFSYPWGEALAMINQLKPDARIINLETSVTTSEEYWPGKSVGTYWNYSYIIRMLGKAFGIIRKCQMYPTR